MTDRYCLYFSLCGTNGGFYYEKKKSAAAFHPHLSCIAHCYADSDCPFFGYTRDGKHTLFLLVYTRCDSGKTLRPSRRYAVYGLGDFLGALIFPTGGAYFPGCTLTAAVSGLIYGLYLGKKNSPLRIVLSVLTSQMLCTLLMNSYWVSTLYGSDFGAVLGSRVPQSLIMTVLQIIFMVTCLEKICKVIKYR